MDEQTMLFGISITKWMQRRALSPFGGCTNNINRESRVIVYGQEGCQTCVQSFQLLELALQVQ
jgi:hypothetical protein